MVQSLILFISEGLRPLGMKGPCRTSVLEAAEVNHEKHRAISCHLSLLHPFPWLWTHQLLHPWAYWLIECWHVHIFCWLYLWERCWWFYHVSFPVNHVWLPGGKWLFQSIQIPLLCQKILVKQKSTPFINPKLSIAYFIPLNNPWTFKSCLQIANGQSIPREMPPQISHPMNQRRKIRSAPLPKKRLRRSQGCHPQLTAMGAG